MIFNPVVVSGGSSGGGSGEDGKQWVEIPIESDYIDFRYNRLEINHNFILLIKSEDRDRSFCIFMDIEKQDLTLPDQTYYTIDGVDFESKTIQISISPDANAISAYFLPDVGISL